MTVLTIVDNKSNYYPDTDSNISYNKNGTAISMVYYQSNNIYNLLTWLRVIKIKMECYNVVLY